MFYVRFDGPPGPESCRFVELEGHDGRGVGPAESGADWSGPDQYGHYRLGPFARVAPSRVATATHRGVTASVEINDGILGDGADEGDTEHVRVRLSVSPLSQRGLAEDDTYVVIVKAPERK